jgi:hypothetical protein
MRTVFLIILISLVVSQSVHASYPPKSPERLQQYADLIVVGQIEKLRIETERVGGGPVFGNCDWAIYLTIKVDSVEKGTFLQDRLEARCRKVKSRRSVFTYYGSMSGNYPIPDAGTHVRAYLRCIPDSLNVIIPNGLASPDPDSKLVHASQLKQLRGRVRYTFIFPVEIWLLILIIAGIPTIMVGILHRKEKTLKGIGGWLILVAVGIVVAPIRLFLLLMGIYTEIFTTGLWESLTSQGSGTYSPFWAPLMIGEILINSGMLLACLYRIPVFLKKEPFPKMV